MDFKGLNHRSNINKEKERERDSRVICIARVKLVDTKSTGSDDELPEMDGTRRGSPRADVNGAGALSAQQIS